MSRRLSRVVIRDESRSEVHANITEWWTRRVGDGHYRVFLKYNWGQVRESSSVASIEQARGRAAEWYPHATETSAPAAVSVPGQEG